MKKRERRQRMQSVTAPGVGDSAEVRIEYHQIGGGWAPVTLHWHDYCEFEFVLAGRGVHTWNNARLPVRRGSAYLCMPNDFHTIRNDPDNVMTMVNVKFSASLVQPALLERVYRLAGRRYCDFDDEADIGQAEALLAGLRQAVEAEPRNGAPQKALVECALNHVLALFLLQCDRTRPPAKAEESDAHRIQAAVVYIHRRFTGALSEEEVAKSTGLSTHYFSALFRRHMQCSYAAYLLDLRLRYARHLIENEHKTKVADITAAVGFSSVSYFIKVFKKKYGVTPGALIAATQKAP